MVNYPLVIYFSSYFEISHFTRKLYNMKKPVLLRLLHTLCLCTISSQIVITKVGMSTPEKEFQIYFLISLNSKCIQSYHNLTLKHT